MDKDKLRRGMFDALEAFVYSLRLVLVPFYVLLAICLAVYLWIMGSEVFDLVKMVFSNPPEGISDSVMIRVLALVDIVMIANLIQMIITGSHSIFVRKIDTDNHRRRPLWLDHISSGSLKVKIAMSIVSVSLIHLLKILVEGKASWEEVMIKLSIFTVFVAAMVAIAWTNRLVEGHFQAKHNEPKAEAGETGKPQPHEGKIP